MIQSSHALMHTLPAVCDIYYQTPNVHEKKKKIIGENVCQTFASFFSPHLFAYQVEMY